MNVTIDDVLARHAGLIAKFSRQYATTFWPVEDLAQEASVALWRETQKRPGDNLDKLASYVIKRRVLKLVTGEGAPFAHREPDERSYSPKEFSSLEGIAERAGDALAPDLLATLLGTVPSVEQEIAQQEAVVKLDALEAAAGPVVEAHPHGTEGRYKRKCRCVECRAAHAAETKAYRLRKAAEKAGQIAA